MILVPVKDLRNAKQRLASVLDQTDRTTLAQAMLRDVLQTLSRWDGRPDVAVVTSDDYALDLSEMLGLEVIPDSVNRSETHAIEMATDVCRERGVGSSLVIPGDIPLIKISELEQVFEAAPPIGSVLVPAADGRGTNAAYRTPCDLFPLWFGNDSFKPHLVAARGTGHACTVLSLPGIALDVDNPTDLGAVAAAPGQTHTQALIRKWGFFEYQLASNE